MSAKKLYKSKIAANGQIVIPKELRDALGLHSGDILTIQTDEVDGQIVQLVIRHPRVTFAALVGLLPSSSQKHLYAKDLQQIDDEEMR